MTTTDDKILSVLRRVPNLKATGYTDDYDQDVTVNDRIDPGEFERAAMWLIVRGGKTRTFNNAISSYGLKHRASRSLQEANKMYNFLGDNPNWYISNGAFICAAIYLDYLVERIGSTPNAKLGISKRVTE